MTRLARDAAKPLKVVTGTIATVRATPKSNTVDNVRALQGDATVLE